MSKIKFNATPVRAGITTQSEIIYYYTVGTESINAEGRFFLGIKSLKELNLTTDESTAKARKSMAQAAELKGEIVILKADEVAFINENGFLPLNENRDADMKSLILETELSEKDAKIKQLEAMLAEQTKKGGK